MNSAAKDFKAMQGRARFSSQDFNNKARALSNGSIPVLLLRMKGEGIRRVNTERISWIVENDKKTFAETEDPEDVRELLKSGKKAVLIIEAVESPVSDTLEVMRALDKEHGGSLRMMVVSRPASPLQDRMQFFMAGAKRLYNWMDDKVSAEIAQSALNYIPLLERGIPLNEELHRLKQQE